MLVVEDFPQEQPYALGIEGFAMEEEGPRWFSCEPSQELQRKMKGMNKGYKERLD